MPDTFTLDDPKNTRQINLTLSEQSYKRLTVAARRSGMTRQQFLRCTIDRAFSDEVTEGAPERVPQEWGDQLLLIRVPKFVADYFARYARSIEKPREVDRRLVAGLRILNKSKFPAATYKYAPKRDTTLSIRMPGEKLTKLDKLAAQENLPLRVYFAVLLTLSFREADDE